LVVAVAQHHKTVVAVQVDLELALLLVHQVHLQ
jgi:hypothetical protein